MEADGREAGLGGQRQARDGRLVVAAEGDGTIRWRRADDGRELLALQVLAQQEGLGPVDPGGILRGDRRARRTC